MAALQYPAVKPHRCDQQLDPKQWDPHPRVINVVSIVEYISSYHYKYEYQFYQLSQFTQNKVVTSGEIQVVEEAPFEVLLGRPFFDITNCSEVSATGGKHVIHIKDPKTGTPYVFATEPRPDRGVRLDRKPDEGVNFRQ